MNHSLNQIPCEPFEVLPRRLNSCVPPNVHSGGLNLAPPRARALFPLPPFSTLTRGSSSTMPLLGSASLPPVAGRGKFSVCAGVGAVTTAGVARDTGREPHAWPPAKGNTSRPASWLKARAQRPNPTVRNLQEYKYYQLSRFAYRKNVS